jgi:hypothetical protein
VAAVEAADKVKDHFEGKKGKADEDEEAKKTDE